jgi:hypothetical protein
LARLHLKSNQSKMDWRCGSSSRDLHCKCEAPSSNPSPEGREGGRENVRRWRGCGAVQRSPPTGGRGNRSAFQRSPGFARPHHHLSCGPAVPVLGLHHWASLSADSTLANLPALYSLFIPLRPTYWGFCGHSWPRAEEQSVE